MVPCKSTAKEVSFEWSHHRISSSDSKVRTTLHVALIDSGSDRANYIVIVLRYAIRPVGPHKELLILSCGKRLIKLSVFYAPFSPFISVANFWDKVSMYWSALHKNRPLDPRFPRLILQTPQIVSVYLLHYHTPGRELDFCVTFCTSGSLLSFGMCCSYTALKTDFSVNSL